MSKRDYDFDKIQCKRCGRLMKGGDIAFELGKTPETSDCYVCKMGDLKPEQLKAFGEIMSKRNKKEWKWNKNKKGGKHGKGSDD